MLGVTLGSLYVDTQGYVPALLENLHDMSCSGTYWLLGGGWFWCRYGGFWMVSYSLMCSVSSGVFWFSQVLGLSLLPLDFSFTLPVVSRLLQLYSTENKTSRLMVKRFSPMRDNQRGSQSYMKKWRGSRGIEMSRRRKRGTQEERQIYTVVCSQSVLHSPDTHKDSQNCIGKRRGKEEIEVF